jgi:predicted MPP superfamily phosphohydrolase
MLTQVAKNSACRLSLRQFIRAFSTPVESPQKPADSNPPKISHSHKPDAFERKVRRRLQYVT